MRMLQSLLNIRKLTSSFYCSYRKIEHLEELLENEKSTKLHLTSDAKDRQDLYEQKIRELGSELQESKHELK